MNLFVRPWRHCVDFRGRSCRLEYGLFLAVFYGLIVGGAQLGEAIETRLGIAGAHDLPPFIAVPYAVFILVTTVPLVAVTVRRLHDIGISGWWLAILFVPVFVAPMRVPGAGLIWLSTIAIAFIPSLRRADRYGFDPRKPTGEQEMTQLGDVFS